MSKNLFLAFVLWVSSGIAFAQSSGTAFAVSPGLLVTNQHVIQKCGKVEVIALDGRRTAIIEDSVEEIDLALLRVYGLRGGTATLRTESDVRLGESSIVFGFPLSGSLSSGGNFTTGVVSSLRGWRDAAGEIQITAPVQPGNSGGPVLDRSGLVIGVVQGKLDVIHALRTTGDIPQNVNFAISLTVLADFLKRNKVEFRSSALNSALDTSEVAEIAQTFTYRVVCTASLPTANAAPIRPPTKPTPPNKTPPKLEMPAQSPSFDCLLARTVVEKLICQDGELSAMERKMAELYRERFKGAANSSAVLSAQRNWLSQQRNMCLNKQCLVDVYQRRIQELSILNKD